VTGRSFEDADDVASVLHYRISHYMTGVGYPAPIASDLIAGLFPRPSGITDPDVVLALNDRGNAIEQRARELAATAIKRGDAWVRDFGDAPPTDELYEQWVLEVATAGAYFERWGTANPDTILDNPTLNHQQEVQRSRVLSAAQRACTLTEVETAPAKAKHVFTDDSLLEPTNHDFVFDL
jgi:hypothetical protein